MLKRTKIYSKLYNITEILVKRYAMQTDDSFSQAVKYSKRLLLRLLVWKTF